MHPVIYWLVGYALPAALAFITGKRFASVRDRQVSIHFFLLLSIVILFTAGSRINLLLEPISVLALAFALLIALVLLGRMGIPYMLSSAIQQCCLLLAGLLLVPTTSVFAAVVLTAGVYAVMHCMDLAKWREKLVVMFVWGVISILLYVVLTDFLLNVAFHAVGGTLLVRFGVLSPFSPRRS